MKYIFLFSVNMPIQFLQSRLSEGQVQWALEISFFILMPFTAAYFDAVEERK
jgi:hypothetical protein